MDISARILNTVLEHIAGLAQRPTLPPLSALVAAEVAAEEGVKVEIDAEEAARFAAECARDAALGDSANWPDGD